jgi:cellulose synthase (UDP-forming)
MDTFLNVQQSSDVSGSVSVFHGAEFQSFRVGAQVYYVGVLPWSTQLCLWAAEYPWLIAIVVVVLAFLLAIWTRGWLRTRARARLTMIEN